MKSLQEEFRVECRVCGGASYKFGADGIQRKCTACDGTGKSKEYRELEKLVIDEPLTESDIAKIDALEREYESVFTCQHCGAKKIHYRLHGYQCPHRCEGE